MKPQTPATWIAFGGKRRIACGAPAQVAALARAFIEDHPQLPVLVFDAISGHTVEVDFRGSVAAVVRRLPPQAADDAPLVAGSQTEVARGPGRPKLGVVAREVTLLPRHWDWLASQPGGASVALRKLVEQAQRANRETDRRRQAIEAAYRFMFAMAGNETAFEEASRSLFAHDMAQLREHLAGWPRDVRAHVLALAGNAQAAVEVAA